MDLIFAIKYLTNLKIIKKWRNYKKEYAPKRLPSGMYRCKKFTFCTLKEARTFCKEYSMYLATEKFYLGSSKPETGNHLNPVRLAEMVRNLYPDVCIEHTERLSSKGMCVVYLEETGRKNVACQHIVVRDKFNRLQLICSYHKYRQFMWIYYSASLITEGELLSEIQNIFSKLDIKRNNDNRDLNMTFNNARR